MYCRRCDKFLGWFPDPHRLSHEVRQHVCPRCHELGWGYYEGQRGKP